MKQIGMGEVRYFEGEHKKIYMRIADVFGNNIEWYRQDNYRDGLKKVRNNQHIRFEKLFKSGD